MTPQDAFKLIKEHCDCTAPLFQQAFYSKIVEPLKPFLVTYEYGASRGVIIFPEEDFVIKIPFTHFAGELGSKESIEQDEDYKGKCENFTLVDDYYYKLEELSGGNEGDYCSEEVNIYTEAQEYGVADFFAFESYLGTAQDLPIYFQTRAHFICSSSNSDEIEKHGKVTQEDKQLVQKWRNEHKYDSFLPFEWEALAIHMYGFAQYQLLKKFIDNYAIGDLHDDNLGYTKDHKPIIIDYATFCD